MVLITDICEIIEFILFNKYNRFIKIFEIYLLSFDWLFSKNVTSMSLVD